MCSSVLIDYLLNLWKALKPNRIVVKTTKIVELNDYFYWSKVFNLLYFRYNEILIGDPLRNISIYLYKKDDNILI